MNYKALQAISALKTAVANLEDALSLIQTPQVTTPAPKPVVQATLWDNVLHIQKGTPGNYKSFNVNITQAEVNSVREALDGNVAGGGPKIVKSLRGTGAVYILGHEYSDDSVRFACVTLPASAIGGANSNSAVSSRRS